MVDKAHHLATVSTAVEAALAVARPNELEKRTQAAAAQATLLPLRTRTKRHAVAPSSPSASKQQRQQRQQATCVCSPSENLPTAGVAAMPLSVAAYMSWLTEHLTPQLATYPTLGAKVDAALEEMNLTTSGSFAEKLDRLKREFPFQP